LGSWLPPRLIVPDLYAYKSVKWVSEIQILNEDEAVYWEKRGYSQSLRAICSISREKGNLGLSVDLRFSVHDASGKIMVTVID